MPKKRIMVQLEPETIEQVDKIRGAVPRAAWVRLLIEDRLRESNATSGLPEDLIAVLEDRGVMIPRDLEVFSKMIYRPEDILPATTASATEPASVSQQEENRSPKPGDERSNRSRRAGKGSSKGMDSAPIGVGRERTPLSLPEIPSRPIKCVCGGIILQDGPKAGKCTKCAKPKEAK